MIHSRFSQKGYADVVIGLQHGDEGKGRFVDAMAAYYDWVARYNGGPNAGHTIEANGHRLALHQVPSGVNHPKVKLFIASDCVVNLPKLLKEIQELEAVGLSVRSRLRISSQASVIQPGHIVRDQVSMKGKIGSTGNGVGATYGDRGYRVDGDRQLDIRLGHLLDQTEWAFDQIKQNVLAELERGNMPNFNVEVAMSELRLAFEELKGCIEPDPFLLTKEIRNGARILLEGAQSIGLDNTFGTTPNVTSSRTGVASAFVSTGIPVDYKRTAYGVVKVIPSRVGNGPFVPEFGGRKSEEYCKTTTLEEETALYTSRIDELLRSGDPFEMGIALRMLRGEYGATTKRPRRIGSFDVPYSLNAVGPQGIDVLLMTKFDCLRDFSRTRDNGIPVVHSYELDGVTIPYVPTTDASLYAVRPHIELHDSFAEDISHIRDPKELPIQVKRLLSYFEDRLGCTIGQIGVGPHRDQVVHLAKV